jgi:ABC-type Na+ efflux pump permease subunit
MVIWTLAKKELRLLLRDRLAAVILLVLPLLFVLVLGLLLGESFGQKPDERLRVSLVDLDRGPCGLSGYATWADVVRQDLAETAGIKVEIIPTEEEASQLIRDHKRAAILVFKPGFSAQVSRCSFLVDGINPFFRDGVFLDKIDAEMLRDPQQQASSIIEQVAQVSLLRVLLPWMIGRAFERLSDKEFIELLGNKVRLPVPKGAEFLFALKGIKLEEGKASLNEALRVAAPNEMALNEYLKKVGGGVQEALAEQFKKYNLTGKTWQSLTKSEEESRTGAEATQYQNASGSGFLNRGAHRYQVLVPAYTVMFAFFLVLNVGWVFVAERTQGTLKRLRAAPIGRGQILLGKLVPYFLLSLGQGWFLLIAGRFVFGMRWGPDSWSLLQQTAWLFPIVFCTSLAAMGLALLVAAVARTEMQVALYGAIPVLVLALIGGCVLPREMMPEQTQPFTRLTPHGWALDAYRELLAPAANYQPNEHIILQACGVLAGFGLGFIVLAWWRLRLE